MRAARIRLLLLCLGTLALVLPSLRPRGDHHVSFSLGPGAGQTSSDVFPGAFLVRPVTGDCVTTPITEIAVSRVGLLQS
jgi:hypothetical protein